MQPTPVRQLPPQHRNGNLLDNLAFGDSTVATKYNVSLTSVIEVRFGDRPRSHYPWNPSRPIW